MLTSKQILVPCRDRGCLYYVPWISILGMLLLGGGTGVW
jgi:hypothetical protein